MAEWLMKAMDVLFILAAIASGGLWIWTLRGRVAHGRPLLEPRSQREPFWSLAEFIVCFGLLLICIEAYRTLQFQLPAAAEVGAEPHEQVPVSPEALVKTQLAGMTIQLLVISSLLVWMGLTRREYLQRYGFWPTWEDLRIGFTASLLIVPPVLLLALLLNQIVEYKHPVIEGIKQQPRLEVWLTMTLGAAIVAPLFEEFMFRALLQGGVQKVARRLRTARAAMQAEQPQGEIVEKLSSDPYSPPPLDQEQPQGKIAETVSPDPYFPPPPLDQEQPQGKIAETLSSSEVAAGSWWPVVISSVLFALVHLGHGAAPVALLLFGAALGYLYRQTGRLWPCIVVHFVLNAYTMIGLGLEMAANAGS